MKKNLLRLMSMIVIGVLAGNATAQNYGFITFKQDASLGGYETSIPIEKLKITFAGGNMIATSPSGVKTLPLNTLSEMFFTALPTSIDGIEGNNSSSIQFSGTTLIVNAPKGTVVRVYDVYGRKRAVSTSVAQGASINLSSLAKGLYVVEVNGRTTKIMKK